MRVVFQYITATHYDVSKPDFSGEEQADRFFIGGIENRPGRPASGCHLKTKFQTGKTLCIGWLQCQVPWLCPIKVRTGAWQTPGVSQGILNR